MENLQYYDNIDTSFSPKILKGLIGNFKIPPKETTKPKRKISERQSYTTELLKLINNEQEQQGKKKYDYRYFAFRISHIPTADLYHCIAHYQSARLFWWSIKAK